MKLPQMTHNAWARVSAYTRAAWEIYLELIDANARAAVVVHVLVTAGLVLWLT